MVEDHLCTAESHGLQEHWIHHWHGGKRSLPRGRPGRNAFLGSVTMVWLGSDFMKFVHSFAHSTEKKSVCTKSLKGTIYKFNGNKTTCSITFLILLTFSGCWKGSNYRDISSFKTPQMLQKWLVWVGNQWILQSQICSSMSGVSHSSKYKLPVWNSIGCNDFIACWPFFMSRVLMKTRNI